MTHTFTYQRHAGFSSERERLLCRFSRTAPLESLPPSSEHHEWLQWLRSRTSALQGEQLDFVQRSTRDVPLPVLRRLRQLWTENPAIPPPVDLVQFFARASEFFRSSSSIRSAVEGAAPRCNFQTMKKLVDHREWLQAFQGATAFTEIQTPNAAVTNVAELLRTMSIPERQRAFVQYVDTYIPRAVQGNFAGVFGTQNPGMDATARFAAMQGGRPQIATTLNGVLGNADLRGGPPENELPRTIVRQSLQARYGTLDINSLHLQQEFTNAVRFQSARTRAPVEIESRDAMLRELPESPIRGLLTQGILDPEQMRALQQRHNVRSHEERLITASTTSSLDRFQGITRAQMTRESETLRDTFDNLGGYEKLALIALAGYLIFNKKTRPFVAALGGAYFLSKFVFKVEDPVGMVSGWMNTGISAGMRWVPERWQPAEQITAAQRAEVMVQFLSSTDRSQLEGQSTGLALLSDMPMNLLSQSFVQETSPGSFPGIPWYLNIRPGSTLDTQMNQTMSRNGWSMNYRQFFAQPGGVRLTSEALGKVFYGIARESLGENDPNVRIVTEALRRPGVQDPADFIRLGMNDAKQAYIMLVTQGVALSRTNNRSLREVVMHQLGSPTLRPHNTVTTVSPPRSTVAESDAAPRAAAANALTLAQAENVTRVAEVAAVRAASVSATAARVAAQVPGVSDAILNPLRTAEAAAQRRLVRAEAFQRVSEATVALRRAEQTVTTRQAEINAARRAVQEAQRNIDAAVDAGLTVPEIATMRTAHADAQARVPVIEAQLRAAEVDVVRLRTAQGAAQNVANNLPN